MTKWLRTIASWLRALEDAADYDPQRLLFERVRQIEARLVAVESAMSEAMERGPR